MRYARGTNVLIVGLVLSTLAILIAVPASAEEPPLVELPPAQGLFDPAAVPTCPQEQGGCNPTEGPHPICWTYSCECRPPVCPTCPAVYERIRYLEDWRGCLAKRPSDRGDWSDYAKAISFGTPWFQADFGGSVRLRWEWWQNQIFSPADAGDDNWLLGRARLHADLHFGNLLRVFVEGIYADQWERELGPRYGDVDQGDLLNGFVELGGSWGRGWTAGVGAGRREMAFGKQRLISPYDWLNSPQTFDGVHGWIGRNHNRLDVFATRPVEVRAYEENGNDREVGFWGLYFTNRTQTCITLEAYFLGYHNENATYMAGVGNEDRFTFGMRFGGEIPGSRFDYDFEGAYQFGEFADKDIRAWFVALDIGWRPPSFRFDPRFAIGIDFASGNSDDEGKLGTFNSLFPDGHEYLGYADIFGRPNLVAVRGTFTMNPVKNVELRADLHGFWRSSEDDAVYTPLGRILIPAVPDIDDKYVGAEFDLSARWRLDRHLMFSAGWAHVFPGSLPEQVGNDEELDFVWLEAEFIF